MQTVKKYKKELSFILSIVVLGCLGSVLASLFDIEGLLHSSEMSNFIQNHYALSVCIYLVSMALATSFLALPGFMFAVISALLFGPIWGTVWCVLAASLGATCAFILGRYFLRDTAVKKLSSSKTLSKILLSDAIENQVLLLAITRLIPIFPFNLQNFAYGVTSISLPVYTLFSTIFLIPGTALYTFLTAGIINESERGVYLIIAFSLSILLALVGLLVTKRYQKFKKEHTDS